MAHSSNHITVFHPELPRKEPYYSPSENFPTITYILYVNPVTPISLPTILLP